LCAHKNWSVKQFYRDGKAASSRRNPKPRKLSGQKFAPICVYPPLALL
jgi:hypothetical protein